MGRPLRGISSTSVSCVNITTRELNTFGMCPQLRWPLLNKLFPDLPRSVPLFLLCINAVDSCVVVLT